MNDTINTGLGGNYNLDFQTQIETPIDTKVQGPTKIQDTVGVSQPAGSTYVFTNPESPKLIAPNADANSQGMETLNDLLKNFTGDIATLANTVPSPDTTYIDAAEENIEDITPDQINSMKLGIPPEQVVKTIRYAVFNPDADVPAQVKEIADQIREKTTAATGQTPSSFVGNVTEEAANFGYNTLLKSELTQMGYTDPQLQQLLAANDMPEFTSSLSPEMQKNLAAAQKAALAGVQADLGVPKNWQIPRDPKTYEKNVSTAYEQNINNKIHAQYSSGQISKAAYNDVRTLLYIPGSSPPNADNLKANLTTVTAQAKSETQVKYGFSNDYTPPVDSQNYQAILTGAYNSSAKNGIAAFKPPLSSSDQALLTKALGDPTAQTALSPQLKTILSTIQSAALAKVAKQYSLPATWQPDATMLANAQNLNTPKLQLTQNIVGLGKDYMAGLQDLINTYNNNTPTVSTTWEKSKTSQSSIPNLLLNYLKACSVAITGMEEVLYSSSVAEANLSAMAARVQQDAQVSQLAAQKTELEKTLKEQEKMASLGGLKIFMYIILFFLMVFTFGALGFLFFALLIANSAAKHHGDLSQMDIFSDFAQTMETVAKALVKIVFGEADADKFDAKFGGVIRAVALIFMVLLCPATLIADLLAGDGSIITGILEGFGVSPTIAGYISMSIQIIIMLIVFVLSIFFAPEAAPEELGLFVTFISARILSLAPKAVVQACDFVIQGLEATTKADSFVSEIAKFVIQVAKRFKGWIMKAAIKAKDVEKQIEKVKDGILNATEQVAKQEKKVADLKDIATTSAKDLAKAEKELNEAKAGVEELTRSLKVLNAQKSSIEGSAKAVKDAFEDLEKAVKKLDEAKKAGKTGKVLEAARDEIKLAQKAVVKAEKKALDTEDDFIQTSIKMTGEAADKAKDALKKIDDKILMTEKQLKTAKDDMKVAIKSGKNADEETATFERLTKELKSLEDERGFVKADFKKASEAGQQEINKALNPIQKIAGVTSMIEGMVQGGVTINNQILQANIALLKGALEAYLAETDTLIKIFQALMTKFLDGLKDLGKTLSKLGSDRQHYWEGLSVTMTDLARAMK